MCSVYSQHRSLCAHLSFVDYVKKLRSLWLWVFYRLNSIKNLVKTNIVKIGLLLRVRSTFVFKKWPFNKLAYTYSQGACFATVIRIAKLCLKNIIFLYNLWYCFEIKMRISFLLQMTITNLNWFNAIKTNYNDLLNHYCILFFGQYLTKMTTVVGPTVFAPSSWKSKSPIRRDASFNRWWRQHPCLQSDWVRIFNLVPLTLLRNWGMG